MPSLPKSYAMPVPVKWFSVALGTILGAGYAFGPEQVSSAPIFLTAKELFPIQVWGILFMFCGVLLAFTQFYGYVVSAMVWSLWGSLLLIGAFDGNLQSWGSIVWPFYFAAVNFMHVYRWGMERKALVRREGISSYLYARRRSREEDR
jgi:hypothetical protein